MHPGAIVKAVYLHVQPVDFRKQINDLSLIVEQELGLCPFDPVLYAFINRRKTCIKRIIEHTKADSPCACGSPRVKIGEDVSEQLDVIPMKIVVRRIVRPIYACH